MNDIHFRPVDENILTFSLSEIYRRLLTPLNHGYPRRFIAVIFPVEPVPKPEVLRSLASQGLKEPPLATGALARTLTPANRRHYKPPLDTGIRHTGMKRVRRVSVR
jgi:hypothetical protein